MPNKRNPSESAVSNIPCLELQKRFGTNFRAIRKKEKLTQKQVALLSEIPQADISRVESGKINLTIRQMQRLSEVVNRNVSISLIERR